MTFRLYDTSIDLETNEAEETWFIGNDTFGYGAFSALSLDASIYNTQSVSITGGQYNLVSFNLLPHYPDAMDVFGGMEELQIVYNDNGGVLIPGYNINTIGDVNFLDGFYVLSNNSQTINYEGTFVNEEDWPIAVEPSKWNYIAMIAQNPVAVTEVFSGLEEEISIVQAASGDAWIPSQGVNTIGQMQPSKGYKIALAVDTLVYFSYPEGSKRSQSQGVPVAVKMRDDSPETTVFSSQASGLPYAVIIDLKSHNESIYSLEPGDEIGLFDGELCVGNAVFQGGSRVVLTCWKQDDSQGLPGFVTENLISAKVYKSSLQKTFQYRILNLNGTKPKFGIGYYGHIVLETIPINEEPVFFSVAPNPFKNATDIVIELPKEDRVSINIFDASGRLVKTIANGNLASGRQQFRWNGTDVTGKNLTPGIYYIVAETTTEIITGKVIILK